MKQAVGALVAAVFCCLLTGCFCQDPTDIHHGCYFDGVDRALQDLITCLDGVDVCQESCGDEQTYCEGQTGMTVEFCRSLCRNRNLQYYALQAGKQCFCGGALANPFIYTEYTGDPANCSYPCSGNANQSCGGDFKMEIYEFKEPVPEADCFHPGFVPNAYVSEELAPEVGETVTFLCEPGHMILGEPQLVCQTQRAWSPDVLPVCNYTGIFPEPTTKAPTNAQSETTTQASTTQKQVSPTTLPLQTITGLTTSYDTPAVSNSVPTIGSTDKALFTSGMVRLNASKATQTHAYSGLTTDASGALFGGKSPSRYFDFLPYIIGGSAVLVFILVVCMVGIFTCKSRKRSGNARQNIRLKPESNPVTFINAGFSVSDEESGIKPGMPDILRASGNLPQSPDHSFMANQYAQNNRVSTFAEEGVYQNGIVIASDNPPQSHYANLNEEEVPEPTEAPPSPLNANTDEAVQGSEPAYSRQTSGQMYATTDRPNSKRSSSSSADPVTVYATGNRRAKKNGTGTKDLIGWSRPSSLYQRTTQDDLSSDEDNTAVSPNQLSDALYAQVDKSRQSSRETLMSEDGNSFFGDPTKTSATRL